jgi:hypothetical protein
MLANPLTMTLWGLIVSASLVIGFLIAFIGLIFVVPILAHASWHLYRWLVHWVASDQDANCVVADVIVKENSAMNTLGPSRSSQDITKSRRIGFLIYPDCEICDVCGPLDVFHFADYWLPRFGRTDEPGYQLVILAATPGPVRTHSGIEIVATQSCYDIKDGLDTLVVAGGINVEQACKGDPALVEWVRTMAPRVRRVTSICTGAFILAAAGRSEPRQERPFAS